jgi:hypothetical protein
LVQVGSFLRFTAAIDYVECPVFLMRTRLVQSRPEVEKANKAFRMIYSRKPISGTVDEIPRLIARAYDRLLAENVVFLNLIAAVANNTIVECIARNTPVVVNRLPGPTFYLGADYPFFYDSLDDVAGLLTREGILSAHHYLKRMDKRFLKGSTFAKQVMEACRKFSLESASIATRGCCSACFPAFASINARRPSTG